MAREVRSRTSIPAAPAAMPIPLSDAAVAAIARFEEHNAVRATSWVLPDLDPKTAASEPHPQATGASARPVPNVPEQG